MTASLDGCPAGSNLRSPRPSSTSAPRHLHTGRNLRFGNYRLDDLVELGVTHVELMPVAEASGLAVGDTTGWTSYAPHHAYGGPEGLETPDRRMPQERHWPCLLDVVYNHLGPCGNYLRQFGPYFTDRYRLLGATRSIWTVPKATRCARFFIDNACMWLRDYHLDGLRIDAVHAIVDTFRRPLSRAVAEGGEASRSPTRAAFRRDCRKRSERSARGTLTEAGRLRSRRPVE